MEIVRREHREAFVTADGSTIRELAGIPSGNSANQSLAEAVVPPGGTTTAHFHRRSEEIYLFTGGSGRMRLGDEERPVRPGDCVVIVPGTVHKLWADSYEPLVLLCCCAPAYSHEDTVLLEDPYHLQRFVDAQDQAGTYDQVLAELRSGRKRSHWMWFVFPQIAGLGQSPTSRRYAISSLEEARAYLAHPVLGARLLECTRILGELSRGSAEEIFGGIDALKLRSSMTLFARADPGRSEFETVLDAYFGGGLDPATERLLGSGA